MTSFGLLLGVTSVLSGMMCCAGLRCCGGDGRGGGPCVPEDKDFETVRVVVQTDEMLNVSEQGEAVSVQLHLYQLTGARSVRTFDFEAAVGRDDEAAFAGEFLSKDEVTIYPGRDDVFALRPDPAARFILAVAFFRSPLGQDWFRLYELPRDHGQSVCAAEARHQPWPDPCFHVVLEGSRMDGGGSPPDGWDEGAQTVQCPGPPMRAQPRALEEGQRELLSDRKGDRGV